MRFPARVARVGALALTALSAGCSIKAAGSVAQPTALELQLLGAYRRLDDELVRSSSIRGSEPLTPSTLDALQARAVEARALQRFNRDDIETLKTAGCLAEGRGAKLLRRACALAKEDPAVARRQKRIVRQENEARSALLAWAAAELSSAAGQPTVTPETMAEVRSAYERLLRQAARAGDLFEVKPGEFEPVKQ